MVSIGLITSGYSIGGFCIEFLYLKFVLCPIALNNDGAFCFRGSNLLSILKNKTEYNI